ncbi:MAG: hypothetical protein ACREF4_03375 [Gammaproteobacteria bacterium]
MKTKGEATKDLLALANSSGRTPGDIGRLVLGAGDDDDLEADGSRRYCDNRRFGYRQKHFLAFVNRVADPKLQDLRYDEIELDGRWYGVISIPPSPHVHRITDRDDLLLDIGDTGLLTQAGPAGTRVYLFAHRTFLEYLVARHVAASATPPAVWRSSPLPDAHVVTWMLAGLTNSRSALFSDLIGWMEERLTAPREATGDAQSQVLAELLADCLLEAPAGTVGFRLRERAWELVARGLDRTQRRRRRPGEEWRDLVDWSLTYRALRAAALHEPATSYAGDMLGLLEDLRRVKAKEGKGGQLPPSVLPGAVTQLVTFLQSPCAIVRWAALWMVAALHAKGRTVVAAEFGDMVSRIFSDDPSVHVQSLAARVFAELQPARALGPLCERLNDTQRLRAAAAAIGLGRLASPQAISALKVKALQTLSEPLSPERDPLPIAIVGSLEAVVSQPSSPVLSDPELPVIFKHALAYPLPLTRGTAASALGKLRVVDVLPSLEDIITARPDKQSDTQHMRASAAFGYQDLCSVIAPAAMSGAANFLRSVLQDADDLITVRRHAAYGLKRLVERGHESAGTRSTLLDSARDRDSIVARTSLYALFALPTVTADEILLLRRRADSRRRIVLYEVAGAVATSKAIMVLECSLRDEQNALALATSLYATGDAVNNASKQTAATPWIEDALVVLRLAAHCVVLAAVDHPRITVTAQATFGNLSRLPILRRDPAFPAQRQALAKVARGQLSHVNDRVLAQACVTLEHNGTAGDIEALQRLAESNRPEKVRSNAARAIARLKERYRTGRR